jgi:hypothetical protein
MKKLAITLSDEDFSMLEELRAEKYCLRNKSREIAWLIKCGWERLQEEKRKKTPAELVAYAKYYVARLDAISASRLKEGAAADAAPCDGPQIIQFPARQIGQFSGSA